MYSLSQQCDKFTPEIVDEDVWTPEMIEELEVDRGPLALRDGIVGGEAGFLPTHSKVHGQGHAELLVIDLSDILIVGFLFFTLI